MRTNSPVVMHLFKNLDNHSDTMQLAISKNLEWNIIGRAIRFHFRVFDEKFDFICISTSWEKWIFWIYMFNKMSVSGRGWFHFCRKGFSNLRKNCLNPHIVFGFLSLQKAYYCVENCFLLQLFHWQASMCFYIMMAFLEICLY